MWKRILCRFGWHSWSPWDSPRMAKDGRGVQYRKCDICNKQQRNIV